MLSIGFSCNDYLDIVPDDLATIDHAFSMRAQAERYLFTCYSYLPVHGKVGSNPALVGGDEITTTTSFRSGGGIHSWYISHGEQSASRVRCDFWRGADGATDMYQGISDCNIFLENISRVPDMTQAEKNKWIAEVKFLKAYYHYWMIRMYGPIPIKDVNVSINAEAEASRPFRNTLDESFEYVVNLLDEVIESGDLPIMIENQAQELGRISQGIAMAIKAEVLVTVASPLYNGNADYKGYTDNRGIEIFNPTKTDEEKKQRWADAVKACEEAIAFLKEQGHDLYYFTEVMNPAISDETRAKMHIRGAFTENWNKEIIWGNPNLISSFTAVAQIQSQAIPRGLNPKATGNATAGGNLGVPLKIANQFYSKNGVPVEEDITWDYEGRFDLKKATSTDKYFIKEGYTTAKLNFDREVRYYASLGFDGAIWFGQGVLDETKSYHVQHKQGQAASNQVDHTWNQTGIFPKKLANYKSVVDEKSGMTCQNYAFPVMTMNNLYLLYAEALNENGAAETEVLSWVDLIRERASLKGVKESWDTFTSNRKYETIEGRREIIQRERNIELAFSGQRFWDLRRWKLAYTELNKPITGWDTSASTEAEYYIETLIFEQKFNVRDYFWPIANDEVYANKNTKQNYGW